MKSWSEVGALAKALTFSCLDYNHASISLITGFRRRSALILRFPAQPFTSSIQQHFPRTLGFLEPFKPMQMWFHARKEERPGRAPRHLARTPFFYTSCKAGAPHGGLRFGKEMYQYSK